MYTRKQYLNKECTHREYYGQFVGPAMPNNIASFIGADKLSKSEDKHLNDIPLNRWDAIASTIRYHTIGDKMRECGDYLTLSAQVCIAKEAARQWIEANKVAA